ncbi:MAG: helix-turn-helix transcriptional regulator [Rhodoplanes sp.]|uniref:winged helix-turn-helix transcriptional regulator n=1 Tax=Rhodoplanes sp. TaxID=1968906 RepID=UPI0017F33DA8|nr:helix-turn-helix domain-containing protein [Rhodoplanes sp.]NVO17486.1 helix-turn-helix transcriptional regulator [Rhodoplanes sp.]
MRAKTPQPKKQASPECPAARAIECVGEWWSILILRDAFQGFTRFDEFQKSLGIAPNMLSRRLAHLTEAGLFARRRYSERPPRHDYVLTEKGRDFFPVLVAMFAWGNKHLTPDGKRLLLADHDTARPLDPIVVDAASLMLLTPQNVALVPGPRASRKMRERLATIRALRPDPSPAEPIPAEG